MLRLFTLLFATFVAAAPCTGSGDVLANCNVQGAVALTFDDGPRGSNYELNIGNTVAAGGGRATFFLNGNNYACIYDQENVNNIRALYEAGHVIASHTWSHADLTTLDYGGISLELERVETALIKILGVKPKYFRPPYGNLNDLAVQVLKDRGYSKIWLWNVASNDAVGASEAQQRANIQSAINQFPSPQLILEHSVQDTTAFSVNPWQVPQFTSRGYRLVTVNQCVTDGEDWPYTFVGPYGTRDSSWVC